MKQLDGATRMEINHDSCYSLTSNGASEHEEIDDNFRGAVFERRPASAGRTYLNKQIYENPARL